MEKKEDKEANAIKRYDRALHELGAQALKEIMELKILLIGLRGVLNEYIYFVSLE